MDFNLFTWIREGVRRSVMLGVADAMQSVGTPPSQDLQKGLSNFMTRIEGPAESSPVSGSVAGSGSSSSPLAANRKRLGRTLRDIEPKK